METTTCFTLVASILPSAPEEVLAQALKSTLNEQKAEHEKFMEAQLGKAESFSTFQVDLRFRA